MKRDLFLQLFPPPDYLNLRPVGLDLSDSSLKYCRITLSRGRPAVEYAKEKPIAPGTIEAGRIKNRAALEAVLKEAAPEFKTKYVVLALPEEPGFTFSLALPQMPEGELRQSIELQLEEHIPLPATGVVFDYEILSREGGYEVAVSAFPRALAEEYAEVLVSAGLIPVGFEGEAQAAARALFRPGEKGTSLVIDLGKAHTGFFVVARGVGILTSTLSEIGGDFLTKAVERGTGLPTREARALKMRRGLIQGKDEKLLHALLPAVSVLRDEIRKLLLYWNSQGERPALEGEIRKIILCGGQATIPGLAEYLGASLGVKTELANVWVKLVDVNAAVPPLPLVQSMRYAVALGLAMRSVNELQHD